ncbi:UNVERIFIED_CONTAM: hypothetical protein Sangu_0401700 [Sesamum angustifolium]|uniref:Uncharacterized protein n=1 Tax=Sesamum angustifolium TaxID=2727405 RepID=A0AAW2QSC8_9LAMI
MGYQGQHLLCEWVIRASILRPRDPTCGTCYWVLAVYGGPLAKMSGRRATLHCGQTMKPCQKARRHVGMSCGAYRMGLGLKMRSYSGEA